MVYNLCEVSCECNTFATEHHFADHDTVGTIIEYQFSKSRFPAMLIGKDLLANHGKETMSIEQGTVLINNRL